MKSKYIPILIITHLLLLLAGCRGEYEVIHSIPENTAIGSVDAEGLSGFYLLNEGNMGSNQCTLDYMDFGTGVYHRNIYAEANPNVVKELGDVGNDIAIYGSKLYAVINVSNYIEVMDAHTTKHIGTIEIPNVRYIAFRDGKAYATSYVTQVGAHTKARVGYVAEIDTATLQVTRTCDVGYQPEELVVTDDKIYIANSGGYMFPDYDHTISVIDRKSFREAKKIDVAINLHRLRLTPYGELIVSSRGDYYDVPSRMYFIDLRSEKVVDMVDVPMTNLDIIGDYAYFFAVSFSHNTNKNKVTYGILNLKSHEVISDNFISDRTEKEIRIPYGIKVNPANGDIYITDAIDYTTPGTLFCYDKVGRRRWTVDTGNIPAHFCFLPR